MRISKAGYKLTPRMTSPFPTRKIKAFPSLLLFFLVPAKEQYKAQYKISVTKINKAQQTMHSTKQRLNKAGLIRNTSQ